MSTAILTDARHAAGRAASERGERPERRRLLARLWDALVEAGERRAHREIMRLITLRNGQPTGDRQRDLELFTSYYVVDVGSLGEFRAERNGR
jgi:hypothetical protein